MKINVYLLALVVQEKLRKIVKFFVRNALINNIAWNALNHQIFVKNVIHNLKELILKKDNVLKNVVKVI